jgi:hypothetical protein
MSLFGNKTQASTQTIASGVTIQTSIYGSVVPVVYGRTRMTGNLIWYGGFQAIAPNSGGSGGGKGGGGGSGGKGGSGSTGTDYKASFAFALAEGTLGGVSNVWSSKSETAFGASNLSFANGDLAQSPWGYLTTNFPGKNLAYAGTGYVCAAAYDLGASAELPNLSYEVTGLFPNAIAGLPDADPKDIVVDVLTNGRYGIGFPSARLGDLSTFSNYCRAAGLLVSPLFDTQQDAATQVNQIVQDCNAEFVWSGASLTIVPYGDANLSANGATYTAPAVALYSLTDDDFLDGGTSDPVQCGRARPSDRMNSVKLEWLNRANQYNIEIVEAADQAAIETYGLRTAPAAAPGGPQPIQLHPRLALLPAGPDGHHRDHRRRSGPLAAMVPHRLDRGGRHRQSESGGGGLPARRGLGAALCLSERRAVHRQLQHRARLGERAAHLRTAAGDAGGQFDHRAANPDRRVGRGELGRLRRVAIARRRDLSADGPHRQPGPAGRPASGPAQRLRSRHDRYPRGRPDRIRRRPAVGRTGRRQRLPHPLLCRWRVDRL